MKQKSFLMAIVLCTLFMVPNFADSKSSTVKEIINVEGVDVVVSTKYVDGLKESVSMKIIEGSEQDIDKQSILDKAEQMISAENSNLGRITPLSLMPYSGPIHYSETGYCPQSSNVLTTNIGDFYAKVITPFYIKLDSTGYYKGVYSGSGTADRITTRETYTKSGASVSWSYPPSVTMTSDTGSTIEDYVQNSNTFLRYRTPVEATSLISLLKLDVTSEITVTKSGIGYPATITISKSIQNFL